MAELISNDLLTLFKREFLEWIVGNRNKRLNILITGKSGVGKSRLVNALVGTVLAKEGQERDSCTNDVTPYKVTIAGVQVHVWDSPGLQDGTCDEELYLANLKDADSKHGFDIVIYCLKMDDRRFYSEDKKAISMLTEGFGKDLWKKAVIALSFANKIEDPNGGDELAYFKGELTRWKREIHKKLTELSIDSKVLDTLPFVPTGNYKKGFSLPTSNNWLAELWISCYCVMNESAGAALYLINRHRLRNRGLEALTGAITSFLPDSCQRAGQGSVDSEYIGCEIPLTDEQEEKVWKRLWKAFKPIAATISGLSTIIGIGITILRMIK